MDLIEAVLQTPTVPSSSTSEKVLMRVDFKKGKGKFPCVSNPIHGCKTTTDMTPKEFQEKGMFFLTTKNPEAFRWASDKSKAIANTHVGDKEEKNGTKTPGTLLDRLENIRFWMEEKDHANCYKGQYEILFRPAGSEVVDAPWIEYRVDTKEYSAVLPSGSWDIAYVMCCGGEKFQQGAPTAFVMYTKNA